MELLADVAQGDVACDGLGIAAREPRRGPIAAGQIECLQNLHDLLVRLHLRPPGSASMTRPTQAREGASFGDFRGDKVAVSGDFCWPSVGISDGRQWGFPWPPLWSFSWPPTPETCGLTSTFANQEARINLAQRSH